MADIILHHYPPSPFSEKVRTGLGLKGLAWQSVAQNRLPDRPELFAMTGGYRRIPVMQIGADIYCDTQCILTELDHRFPEPGFFPDGKAIAQGVARWVDVCLFPHAVRIAVAPLAAELPAEFLADRARLYLGPDGDFAREAADLPHHLAQFRAQLGWLDQQLSGHRWLLGDQPGMADLAAWYVVWVVAERYRDAMTLFGAFPALSAWMARMRAIGHGHSTPISPAEALEVAAHSEPTSGTESDPGDSQGLTPGTPVTVVPATDSGDPEVAGRVRMVTTDRIVLDHANERCGRVAIHFPRAGYRVTVAD